MAGSAACCQLPVNTACSSVCHASQGDYRMIYCSVYTVDPCSFGLCPGILYVANCCIHQLLTYFGICQKCTLKQKKILYSNKDLVS